MTKLPVISGKELIKAFEKIGFVFVRQKGSHVIMKHKDNRVVTIPLQKEIKKGTLKKESIEQIQTMYATEGLVPQGFATISENYKNLTGKTS